MQKNIMITGVSGLIGGHIARYFCTKGHAISCLVRDHSDISFVEDLSLTYVKGDITDPVSLEKAFQNTDCIIHAAAKVTDWGERNEFFRVNVAGTINVLKAALLNNVRQVIITGSVSSYGEENSTWLKDETSPYNSHYPYAFGRIFPAGMNFYRDSKARMTQEAIDFALLHSMNLTILEPVWVYGENERNSGFFEYIREVKRGRRFMPGDSFNLFHVIHATDLARAYYLAFIKNLQGVHRIIAGNVAPVPMHRITSLFCKEANVKMPVLLPKFVVYPIGFFMELVSRLLDRDDPPPLTRARVNMYYDSICYNTSKAKQMLGFTASIPLGEGISRTVQWYLKKQWL